MGRAGRNGDSPGGTAFRVVVFALFNMTDDVFHIDTSLLHHFKNILSLFTFFMCSGGRTDPVDSGNFDIYIISYFCYNFTVMGNQVSLKKKQDMVALLAKAYPDAKPALQFQNPFELLIAVLLSAQCTDERVNIVTEELFKAAPDAFAMAELGEEKIREMIKSCGLYKNKAKNIAALSKILAEEYDGKVPSERDKLERLPGIGRKSANVVMSVAFDIPALAVDTHVFRVSRRMGFSAGKDVRKVEEDLTALIPREDWAAAHHWLIFHGRRCCKAQRPLCDDCPVTSLCPRLMMKKEK